MTASPGDEMEAGAVGRGRMRASHADREQVIEALKDAFVDGRLSRGELDARAGRALSARTCADLAALAADIPPAPAAARPGPTPPPARRRLLARAAAGSGGCLALAAAAIWVAFLTDPEGRPGPNPYQALDRLCFVVAFAAVLAALGFLVYGTVGSVEQRTSGGQLPPRPRPGGQARQVEQRGGTGHDPLPPGAHADQTRADLRTQARGRIGQPLSGGAPGRRATYAPHRVPYNAPSSTSSFDLAHPARGSYATGPTR